MARAKNTLIGTIGRRRLDPRTPPPPNLAAAYEDLEEHHRALGAMLEEFGQLMRDLRAVLITVLRELESARASHGTPPAFDATKGEYR